MPLSWSVMVASWCCCCPAVPLAPAWPPSSLVASDLSGGAGFPPGSRDIEVAPAAAEAGGLRRAVNWMAAPMQA